MVEKIVSIERGVFKADEQAWNHYEGFLVTTNKQTVKIGVSEGQSCCESFDCISSEDDFTKFIGAELKSVAVVDTGLNTKILKEVEYLDAGDAMFVNLDTTKGLLQFVAYNCHNGYYGHDGVLISQQVTETKSL